MPKELGSQRLDALRQILLEQRQELLNRTERLLAGRRRDQQQQREESVADAGDMAHQDSTGERDLALVEQQSRLRQQYDLALQRLDEGTYGICEDCGQPISEARLRQVPFARRCVACQSKAEELERIEREPDRHEL
jgi:DnaK suppressor protein